LGTTWKDIAGAASVAYLRPPTGAGVYLYRVAVVEAAMAANKICRIASNNLVINVHREPDVNAGADRTMLKGDTIHLNATVTGENPSWRWKPANHLSDVLLKDPIASPTSDISYTIYAESSFGCRNSDAVSVKVVQGIFVPTAFTPNNDGINDRWRIPFLDPLLGARVNVYNRYGRLVYSAEGTPVNWDGTINGRAQNTGTYVYHIKLKNGRHDMKGTFMLLR
jgi:gliding motility-associated-like protein